MTPTDVDRAAPIVAHHEIDVAADLGTVWDLLTAVDAWPSWNPEITEATLHGPFAPGSSFRWSSYDFPVTSTIYQLEDHRRILWGGQAQGITGVHEWRFAPTSDGVHVTTTESFAGDPVEIDPTGLAAALETALTGWLARIKQAAEAGAAPR